MHTACASHMRPSRAARIPQAPRRIACDSQPNSGAPSEARSLPLYTRAGFEANQHKKKTHSRFRLPNSSVFKGPAGFAARAHMRLREFLLEASESIPLPNSREEPSHL